MFERAVFADHLGAGFQIGFVEEGFHGDGDKVGIGEVSRAVGIGESACFGDEMRRLQGLRREILYWEMFQNSENLEEGLFRLTRAAAWRRR